MTLQGARRVLRHVRQVHRRRAGPNFVRGPALACHGRVLLVRHMRQVTARRPHVHTEARRHLLLQRLPQVQGVPTERSDGGQQYCRQLPQHPANQAQPHSAAAEAAVAAVLATHQRPRDQWPQRQRGCRQCALDTAQAFGQQLAELRQ